MSRAGRELDNAFRKGRRAHKAGDLATAEWFYQSVLSVAPHHADALHCLGVLRHQQGAVGQAVECLDRAAAARPDSAAVAVDLGTALAAKGALYAAESAFRRGVSCEPGNPLAPVNLARLLLHLGRAHEAVTVVQSAMAAQPRRVELIDLLAQALAANGRVWDAARTLSEALETLPDEVRLWTRLAGLHRQLGEREAALNALRETVRLEPRSPVRHVALGEHHLNGLELWEAEAAFESALTCKTDTARAWVGLAEVRQIQGRFADALAHAKRALEINGDDLRGLLAHAEAERCLGETAAALTTMGTAKRVAPDHPAVARAEAITQFDDSAPEAAYEALVRQAEQTPQARQPRFQLALLAGWMGWESEAEGYRHELADLQAPGFILDSIDFALANRERGARLMACPYATLAFALDAAPETGLVIDLGVFHGASTNFLAARTQRTIYGFDSFEGLPEPWGDHAAGTYSVGGRLPAVRDNVELRPGWFHTTLSAFAAERAPDAPVALMNVDCDIYSSTKTALDALADRIVCGTILVFDEYFATARWREDEHRALVESADAYGWTPIYLAFNGFTKQAVVRIQCS